MHHEPDQEPMDPETEDEETPEELIAFGKRAQVWNVRALAFLAISSVAMLLVFFFTQSQALRIIFAAILMTAAATAMGTSVAVFSLRTERKRRGIGDLEPPATAPPEAH